MNRYKIDGEIVYVGGIASPESQAIESCLRSIYPDTVLESLHLGVLVSLVVTAEDQLSARKDATEAISAHRILSPTLQWFRVLSVELLTEAGG